jgi:hypothetical protein
MIGARAPALPGVVVLDVVRVQAAAVAARVLVEL